MMMIDDARMNAC